MKPSKKERDEEDKKIRYLRMVIDITVAVLRQANLSVPEAFEFINQTKQHILALFPDKEDTYNLIYKPRFERIIKENLETN